MIYSKKQGSLLEKSPTISTNKSKQRLKKNSIDVTEYQKKTKVSDATVNQVDEQEKEKSPRKKNKKEASDDEAIEAQSKNSNMSAIERDIKDTQKAIDWSFKEGELDFSKKLFPQFEQRNTIKTPYTYTLIEDSMYVDEGVIIALQYHVFNDDQDYILLKDVTNEVTEEGKGVSKLNTHNYQKEGQHPMSMFKNPPKNYEDRNHNFVENHEAGDFMTAQEKEIRQSFKIEGVLCFWRVSVSGKMEKITEKSFSTGKKFARTSQGNMVLQITNDKKVLTLAYISNYGVEDDDMNKEGTRIIKNDSSVQIMAWAVDIKNCTFDMELHSQFKAINKGISNYLRENAKNINLIRSIQLTASQKYIILTYNLQANRIDTQALGRQVDPQMENAYVQAKHDSKKIARKYAIFDVKTGKCLFEYGGCYQELTLPADQSKLFNLGIAIKDTQNIINFDKSNKEQIKVHSIDEEIVFFYTGKIIDWQPNIEAQQVKLQKNTSHLTEEEKIKRGPNIQYEDYDWTLVMKSIKLKNIIESGQNPSKRKEWVSQQIQKYCAQLRNENKGDANCFQFKSKVITLREDWEVSIIIQVNSFFDQIGVLNIPQVSNYHNQRCFFLYCINNQTNSVENIFEKESTKQTMPQVVKILPKEGLILHGRNSQLRKDMYFIVQTPGQGGYGQCLKLDKFGKELNIKLQIQIPQKHVPYNLFDVWCYEEHYMKGAPSINGSIDEEKHLQVMENDNRCVMQICSIDQNSLQLELISKIPRKISLNRYDYLVRSSDTLHQQFAQWPFFAYCLGIQKICLTYLSRLQKKREYIYQLEQGHRFLCFVDFNSYKDVGFFAEELLIEACIRVCFMTRCEDCIYLQLLLIDPYHAPMQFSVFTSSHVVYDKDFKADDMIETALVIPNKRSQEILGKDKEFSIYLIAQYKGIIKRQEDDSDFGLDYSDVYTDDKSSKTKMQQLFLEQVYMQFDEKNFVYYVAKQGSVCRIMEINPKKSNIRNHQCIFELKSERCSGLSVSRNGQEFIFLDTNATAFVLERVIDSRRLRLVSENNMNETFQSDFAVQHYDPIIISPQYIIQRDKIFYLWDKEPFPNGILMMQDITEDEADELPPQFQNDIRWFQGPIAFSGSNQYGIICRIRNFYAYLKVLSFPDSTTKTLMIDNMNMIDMSTFLENGDILLRCGHRYLVFDRDGFFKSQVYFSDYEDQKGEDQTDLSLNIFFQKQVNQFKKKKTKKETDPIEKGQLELGIQDEGQSSDEFEQKQNIGQHNKMELLQMSTDNKKFLFLNKISQRMKVYKLITKKRTVGDNEIEEYYFEKMFTLDQKNSELLKEGKKFMHGENKFPFRDYLDKCLTINVELDGSVNMMLISQPDRQVDQDMKTTFFEVVISLFKVEFNNGRYKILTHNIKDQIQRPSSEEIEACHIYETDYIENRINDVKMTQSRLPAHLKDATELEIIQDNLLYLEERRRRLIHAINSNGLIVIWQGSWIRWTRIYQDDEGVFKIQKLQTIDVTFDILSEIIRVSHARIDEMIDSGYSSRKISKPSDLIQILLKNHSLDQSDNKYIILTWDITADCQISILEVQDEKNQMLEFNLLKGMHAKLNYFEDKHAIIDLDSCIPICATRNQEEQASHKSYFNIQQLLLKFSNQRKIFEDTTRYLQALRPRNLTFSYSYLNLLLWKDINYKKNKLSLFRQVVKLTDFMVDFDGQSLFHVYVQKSDIIQYIHDLYKSKKRAGKLTSEESILPLFMMNNDIHNYTALFRSIECENFKSFELLCSMLQGMQDRFITRNIIRSLPRMIQSESESVLSYFDHNCYTPMAYEEPLILPWPESLSELQEVVFTTKTTMITTKELLHMLASTNENKQQDGMEVIAVEKKPAVLLDEETKLVNNLANLKKEVQFLNELEQQNTIQKSIPRDCVLPEEIEDNSLTAEMKGKNKEREKGENSRNKRVLVRVIDFDFLFMNDNSVTLIKILSSLQSNQILTKSSIKAFIGLMWTEYQPTIFTRVFLFYFAYLFLTVQLCGNDLPQLWAKTKLKKDAKENGTYSYEDEPQKHFIYISIIIQGCILVFNASYEFSQLVGEGFFAYFSSFWNFIDATQMIINSFILVTTYYFLFYEENLVSQMQIVRIAAYGNFLMWMKMFYWMRLFQATAKYVELITQTLMDLTYFIIMVLIIILAFATFFFIININGKAVGLSYIPDYGMSPFLNAVVSVYLVTLGEFSYDNYSAGPNVASCWLMFICATFFNCVMFMNMLIAIMSQTFAVVTESEEANGLQQQVSLISDYISLVDHKKIWGKKRYIMRVQIVEQSQEEDTNIRDLLQSMEEQLDKQNERQNYQQQKKLNMMEEMLDSLQEQQGEIKSFMQQIIQSIKDMNESQDSQYLEIQEKNEANNQQNSQFSNLSRNI